MEMLKPKVQEKIAELNRRHMDQANGWGHVPQNSRFDSSFEWPPIKKQSLTSFVITKVRMHVSAFSYCLFNLLVSSSLIGIRSTFTICDQVAFQSQALGVI